MEALKTKNFQNRAKKKKCLGIMNDCVILMFGEVSKFCILLSKRFVLLRLKFT